MTMSIGSPTTPLPDGSTRVAVVIEDDADIRNLLRAILAQAGFTCYTAEAGDPGVRDLTDALH